MLLSRTPSLRQLLLPVYAVFLCAFSLFGKGEQCLIHKPYSDPSLSPNKQHLAFLIRGEKGERFLRVLDLNSFESSDFFARQPDKRRANITSYVWVDTQSIAVLTDGIKGSDALYLANLDSKKLESFNKNGKRELVKNVSGNGKFYTIERSAENKNRRMILENDPEGASASKELYGADAKSLSAIFDQNGELRMIRKQAANSKNSGYFLRAKEGNEWSRIALDSNAKVFGFVSNKNDDLLVSGWLGSSNPELCVYDPLSGQKKNTLLSRPEYDVGEFVTAYFDDRSNRLVGLCYYPNMPTANWFHPDYKELQATLDQQLPGSYNEILDVDWDRKMVLVRRVSTGHPDHLVWKNFDGTQTHLIYANGGKVKPSDIGVTKYIEIRNRDGVVLPAYVTFPKTPDLKNLPLVVLVGRDPYGPCQKWEWSPEANFFASHGFVALEINHRQRSGMIGAYSVGNDRKAVSKMLNDVHDGIAELVNAGIVDGNQVGIVGNGLGAWFASQAAVDEVWDFGAIVCLNGLYDLKDYRENSQDGDSVSGTLQFWRANPGSVFTDADLVELSPALNADKLPDHVFVAWGKWSSGGFVKHSEAFVKSARKAGKKVRIHNADWWGPNMSDANRVGVYNDAIKFLNAYLK